MTLRNAIAGMMLTLGIIGLLASRGQTLTLNVGPFTVSTGTEIWSHSFYVMIPAGVLVVLIAAGLALILWPRGRKAQD